MGKYLLPASILILATTIGLSTYFLLGEFSRIELPNFLRSTKKSEDSTKPYIYAVSALPNYKIINLGISDRYGMKDCTLTINNKYNLYIEEPKNGVFSLADSDFKNPNNNGEQYDMQKDTPSIANMCCLLPMKSCDNQQVIEVSF